MIERLVLDLPEVYQPIYGHPELSDQSSRVCDDRLEQVFSIHDALYCLLKRPIKVLDLGCAQGYFSLNLAKRGAVVHGVDFLDKNIAVCDALALESPTLRADFEIARLEDVIAVMAPEQYDLVLGLSVFHHVAYEKGASQVKAMLERLAVCCGALVLELALRDEPLYWAQAQPENPRLLIEEIGFVHEVGRHGTHLSPTARPLFVASNHYWVLQDSAGSFDSWSSDPHALANGVYRTCRRYFFSADYVLKLYRLDDPVLGEFNRVEFSKEIQFLQQPPPDFPAPKLMILGCHETEAWLGMQRLPGRLLLDVLNENRVLDARAILLAILEQLAALESSGLYHNDVRTWNVLIDEAGTARLIDYGSISSDARDCNWPTNLFLSFLMFVHELATGKVNPDPVIRTISISPSRIPIPYRRWVLSLWQRPLREWSFGLMYKTLLTASLEETSQESHEVLEWPMDLWMTAMEEALQTQKVFNQNLIFKIDAQAQQVESRAQQVDALVQQQAKTVLQHVEERMQSVEARAQGAEVLAQQTETRAQQVETLTRQLETTVHEAEIRTQYAETRMQEAEIRMQEIEVRIGQINAVSAQYLAQLHAVHASTS